MAANDWLLQHLADILQCRVVRPSNLEATAWGAARCAASSHGSSIDSSHITMGSEQFIPKMPPDERQQLLEGWHAAVNSCIQLNA